MMKHNHAQIGKIKLEISDNCPKEYLNTLQYYWELQDSDLVNTPKQLKKKFQISQTELTQLVATYTTLTLYCFCENCISFEKHQVKSQSAFRQVLSDTLSRTWNTYNCNFCKEEKQKQLEIEQQKNQDELLLNLNTAIQSKNWNNLSNFERNVLSKCLEMDFNQVKIHYGKVLGKLHFIKLIRALENIEHQRLLKLNRSDSNNFITSYQYLEVLQEYNNEIKVISEQTNSSVNSDTEGDTIKLKLTINEQQYHPDSPMYSGTVKFKERIVIEPDVEYIFGQWHRANDNMYLTLTPLENFEKLPEQKKISKMPISMQKGITDFLNKMGEEIDF